MQGLLSRAAKSTEVKTIITGSREAEAIKLFANTYLAMKLSFFNELDSYALAGNMDSREIIEGVSLDARIETIIIIHLSDMVAIACLKIRNNFWLTMMLCLRA